MSSFTPIGVEAVIKGLDTFNRGMGQMQSGIETTTKTAEKAAGGSKKFSLSLTDVYSGLQMAGKALEAVKRVYDELVGTTLANAKAQIDFARMTGMSGKEAYKLIEIGDDLQISQSALTMAIKTMSTKGIEPTIESLIRMGEQYRSLPSQAEKNKFATDNFGRSGLELQKILEMDADSLRAMGAESMSTGKYMSGEGLAAMEAYRLKVDELADNTEGLKTQMGLYLALLTTEAPGAMGKSLQGFTSLLDVRNQLILAFKNGRITEEQYNETLRALTNHWKTAAEVAKELADAENELSRETNKASNASIAAEQANKKYGRSFDNVVNGVDDMRGAFEGFLSPAEKAAAKQAEIDAWNKKVADSTDRVKKAQDLLAGAYDNLKAAQDNWMINTGTGVADMLGNLLPKDSEEYRLALAAIDEIMGTNLESQNALTLGMQSLTAEYAKTGDIEAFKEGLRGLFGFMAEDTAVQEAKDQVDAYTKALNDIPSLVETYVYTYYIDVQGGPGGGGWRKGKKGEPVETERAPLMQSLAARAVETMSSVGRAATMGYSALAASIKKLSDALDVLAGGEGKKKHKGKLKALQALFDYAEGFSEFASALADRYQSTVIDPLQEGLDVLDETIAAYGELDTTLEDLGAGFVTFGQAVLGRYQNKVADPLLARIEAYDTRISEINDILANNQVGWGEDQNIMDELADLQAKRTQSAEEYAAVQERITRLQEKQADFEYLQQQMDFLRFMSEHGLDPEEILGGVELGLGANYEDLLEAMTRATAQVIEQQKEEIANYQEEELRKAEELAALEAERAAAAEELAAAQQRILDIQQKQADLEFLKQQFEFLAFLKENGLNPADILNGLTLGLGADLPALLEAMANAMQLVIEKAQEELGIGSPSKVFRGIGMQVMAGLTQGIGGLVGAPMEAMRAAAAGLTSAAQMAMPALAPAYGGAGGRTVNVNISGTSINNGMDWATFKASVKSTVKEAMRYG